MKLKLVVSSMIVSGLISSPLFAETKETPTGGYKGEIFAMPCPKVTIYSPMMDAMSQNVHRAKSTVDCDKPLQFAGGINFDTQLGNLNQGFMGENNNRFTLNDAYINATGNVNRWVSAFVEVSYNNINNTALNSANFGEFTLISNQATLPGLYSAGYTLDGLDLQQGYITLGNPALFPLFLKVGKQFQDFGRYTIHPMTRSMTQVMTETLQTSAELSFISLWNSANLHGSFFTFQNQISEIDESNVGTSILLPPPGKIATNHGNTNFGAQLGIGQVSAQLGWDIGVGYINDMMGVNDIAYAAAFLKSSSTIDDGEPVNVDQSYYWKRVSGLTAYGTINSGPFSLSAHYVTTLQHFDPFDFTTDMSFISEDGPQPWAADMQVAYAFNAWERAQNIYIGYQQSGDAVELFLPEHRWVAGYGMDVLKNTNIGVEYSNDQGYSISDGGNNENTNRVALRVGVMFG